MKSRPTDALFVTCRPRLWLAAVALAGLAFAGASNAQITAPTPEPPVAAPAGNAAADPATASATDAYTSFRTEFDAGRYAEAVPHAERALQLAQTQATTPAAEEVQVALMNLGMVQNLSDDFVGAESTYLQVIKLIESSGRPLHDRLARAHAGLASAYHDGKRHDLAVKSFDQAIALKRRHEGLLTSRQVPLIEKYIDSLTELGRYQDALQAQKYLLRIATREYGPGSPKIAPTLQDIGLWYASIGAYDQSRRTLKEAISLVETAGGPDSPQLVEPLLALGTCNRLQLLDPAAQPQATPDDGRASTFQNSASTMPTGYSVGMMVAEGERALQRAADIVDRSPQPSPVQVLTVRTQLGDWYQLRNQPERAGPNYQQAWRAAVQLNEKATGRNYAELIFGKPILLHRVRPDNWNRYAQRPPSEVEVRNVLVEFTVDALGRPDAVELIDDSGDAKRGDRTVSSIRSTARYRPRFENGAAVATPGVQLSQPWILLLPPPATTPAPAPVDTPAAESTTPATPPPGGQS